LKLGGLGGGFWLTCRPLRLGVFPPAAKAYLVIIHHKDDDDDDDDMQTPSFLVYFNVIPLNVLLIVWSIPLQFLRYYRYIPESQTRTPAAWAEPAA